MTESVGNNENLNDFGTYHCNLNPFPVVSFDSVDRQIRNLPSKVHFCNIGRFKMNVDKYGNYVRKFMWQLCG
jgi:hypothetical protein